MHIKINFLNATMVYIERAVHGTTVDCALKSRTRSYSEMGTMRLWMMCNESFIRSKIQNTLFDDDDYQHQIANAFENQFSLISCRSFQIHVYSNNNNQMMNSLFVHFA